MDKRAIAVLGTGWMGSAIANTLIREGHAVVVWNRSALRTQSFEGRARRASTVLDAIWGSDLVMVCVSDYDASDEVLREPDVVEALSGKVLIQFSSGTPRRAREAGRWAQDHNVGYLDCTMSAGPQQVGTAQGTFHYTGPRELFVALGDVLMPLVGTSDYCGEEWGYAAALDFARLGTYTGVLAVLGALLALVQAEGVSVEDFIATVPFLSSDFLEGVISAATADHYPSGTATLTTWKAWADQFVVASRDAGLDTGIAEIIRDSLARSVERGHGTEDIYALLAAFAPSTRPGT